MEKSHSPHPTFLWVDRTRLEGIIASTGLNDIMKEMAYVSHFCILTETPKHLDLPIENTQKPLRNSFATLFSNAYMILGGACFLLAATFLFFGSPQSARGFWPISLLSASEGDMEQPVLHDESIPLLKAAMHSDPDPFKGNVDIAVTDGSALVANAGPDGSFPTAHGIPNAGQISVYIVRDGDALSEIASMFVVSINTILWENDLELLSETSSLPKFWQQIKTIQITPSSELAKKWTKSVSPPIAINPKGTYRLEILIISWDEEKEHGVIIQYNLIDLKTENMDW